MNVVKALLSAPLFLLLSSTTLSADVTRADAKAMLEDCQAQRTEKIAPLKAEQIESCVAEGSMDKPACETFYAGFGDVRFAGGIATPGMFWELPTCQDALAAEKYFKKNPGKDTWHK